MLFKLLWDVRDRLTHNEEFWREGYNSVLKCTPLRLSDDAQLFPCRPLWCVLISIRGPNMASVSPTTPEFPVEAPTPTPEFGKQRAMLATVAPEFALSFDNSISVHFT